MEANDVKGLIISLAKSQGKFGRLYRAIEESPDPTEVYKEIGKGCEDVLDLIMKLECDE